MAEGGMFDFKHWILLVVGAVVLLEVIVRLLPDLSSALSQYAANDTSGFGGILQSIVPLLLGVAILIAFVVAFMSEAGLGKKEG